MLTSSGWVVQVRAAANLGVGRGVAIREFEMRRGHGTVDYMLFVDRHAVGILEAKPEGASLTGVEVQSAKYTAGLPDDLSAPRRPLPFAYESTGVETRFTNLLDPESRSRSVFAVHRPETLADWIRAEGTLRSRLNTMPPIEAGALWPAQIDAVSGLEASLAANRPRALVQMTTGSGKTFMAANLSYRLVKHAKAARILFLVDRANLGRQTIKEFQQFITPDDGRKFTELYNVQHLGSSGLDPAARVVVGTIQRVYSILRGVELPDEEEERSLYEFEPAQPVEVAYNPALPMESFDIIIVDECHRSIYGLWRQVLDYFDAFVVGLTATPSKQTLGFFDQNLVTEYGHEQAVADGVNVDFDVYRIKTEITGGGSQIETGLVTAFRNRETRKMRWEKLEEDLTYVASDLDRKVVAKDQIRTVISTFRNRLFTEIFPGRSEVPKTLIFAKDDSHADDIVQIVREEFGKGNDFAVKITYRTTGRKPEDLLQEFRNSYNPRIVVTVDMIATGTDVKPLECVFFMRSVRSRTFFEQMKGRGVRIIDPTTFQAVTPDAKAKTRFVIVDAVGVTESPLNDTQPLDRQPTVQLDKLLDRLAFGNRDPDLVSSVAARLARLDRQLTRDDREELREAAGGLDLRDLVRLLVESIDPDVHVQRAQTASRLAPPTDDAIRTAAEELIGAAIEPLATNPALRRKLLDVRRSYEQTIDATSKDKLLNAGYSLDAAERARVTVTSFREFIDKHHDEITALQVLYSRPHRARLTFKAIKELAHAISRPPLRLTPEVLWAAYEQLDRTKVRGSGARVLTDIVSLVRFALEQEGELVPYPDQVRHRFSDWLQSQETSGVRFSPSQLAWLEMIRDHVATSLAISPADFESTPFFERGGLGKAYSIFGDRLELLLDELNEALAA
jgi:type I restriction enzyme, R subunit